MFRFTKESIRGILNKYQTYTYGEITLTPEVSQEYGKPLPDSINIVPVKNKDKQKEFEKLVDLGEASAIALALELPDCVNHQLQRF